jgi:hypothetical protein
MDGSYIQRQPSKASKATGSQRALIDWFEMQYKEATRLKKRTPQGLGRRNVR